MANVTVQVKRSVSTLDARIDGTWLTFGAGGTASRSLPNDSTTHKLTFVVTGQEGTPYSIKFTAPDTLKITRPGGLDKEYKRKIPARGWTAGEILFVVKPKADE